MMNVDSCNHICTHVPPEMKATIDELTKRATEKESKNGTSSSTLSYVHIVHVRTRLTHTYMQCMYVHTVCSIICKHIVFTCTCGPCAVEVHGDGSQARTAPAVQTEWKSR